MSFQTPCWPRGRHTASTEDLLELTGLDRATLHGGLHWLRQSGVIISPARGTVRRRTRAVSRVGRTASRMVHRPDDGRY